MMKCAEVCYRIYNGSSLRLVRNTWYREGGVRGTVGAKESYERCEEMLELW